MNHGLGVDRDVTRDGVAELVGQRGDERAAHVGQLADVAGVQVLAERHGTAEPRGERVVGRGGQIVVDLIVDQLAFGHAPADLRWRGRLGSALEPLVVRVVRAERVVHFDPGGGHELGGHVAEDAADLGRVLGHVEHEEGVVPAAVGALVLGQRVLEAERLVLPVGREVGEIVPVRWRPQQAELQSVGVVAALQVVAARVDVRDVGAQLEVVAQAVGSIEPHRRPRIEVVRAGEDSPVAQVRTRQVERRPVIATRDGQRVLRLVAGDIGLVRVVVRCRARRNRGAPAGAAEEVAHAGRAVAAHGAERGIARHESEGSLAPRALQRIGAGDVVGRDRAAERVAGRAGGAVLGRDEHHPLARARAVDGRGGRTLQNLHRLDVAGVDIRGPVGLRGPLDRARGEAVGRVEVGGREGRVVDRHAVHHEQRLGAAGVGEAHGTLPPDRDVGARARLAARRRHGDVGGFGGERLDHVPFVAALDEIGADVVAHVAELLGRRGGTGARHNDLAELQWVRREHEVLRDAGSSTCQ